MQKFKQTKGENMKKQIMSIVASAALLTTGAMAFDAKADGTIVTQTSTGLTASSYTAGVPAAAPLTASATQRGDALIYPAFNQKTGWGTEIVVRNTSENAVVAKAVLYAANDSRELIDFNIYLSAKDVCRFTIKDGKITSTDGSIRTYGIFPHQVDLTETSRDLTDYAAIKFADTEALEVPMTTEAGYVAIYGMEQSSDFNGFHQSGIDHSDIYAAYAASLDLDRSSAWRQLTNTTGAMVNGMFVKDVTAAPDVAATTTVNFVEWNKNKTLTSRAATFTGVDPVLSGQVRIYNDAGRDVLLPATALANFTDDAVQRVLWTEGEYASVADRQIAGPNYVAAPIAADAVSAFPATTATYTYANASGTTDNSLLVTQPFKRILAQLNLAATNGYTVGSTDATTKKVATGKKYAFQVALSPFDEAENGFQAGPDEIGGTIITSPRTSDTTVVTPKSFKNELQEIKPTDLEKITDYAGKFDNLDGIVEVALPVASIVTQMTASKAGSSDEINWVYSDNTRP